MRMFCWLRQAYCGLSGHDALLQFKKERMFLQCVSCGHETPGWELNEPARRSAFAAMFAVLDRASQLISKRRIA